jgi:transposase-like protein
LLSCKQPDLADVDMRPPQLREARDAYEAAQRIEDVNERRRQAAIPLRDIRYFAERRGRASNSPRKWWRCWGVGGETGTEVEIKPRLNSQAKLAPPNQ